MTRAAIDDQLAERFALCPARNKSIVPIPPRNLADGMVERGFKQYIAATYKIAPTDANGQYSLWLMNSGLSVIDDVEMRPDMPPGFFREARGAFLNAYNPPVHPPVTDEHDWAVAEFGRFMEHLLPEQIQRWWFVHWLAYKVQNPASRGVAVLMVAANVFGAGRGTLFHLLERLFGFDYVRTIPWPTLAGEGGQGQFNAWAAESVIVCVDEIGKKEGVGRHAANRETFEKLKSKIDPGLRQMDITIKNLTSVKKPVFFSTIAATNNKDAIAIPLDDRRFTVLENGEKMPKEMAEQLEKVREDDGAVAAIWQYLKLIDVSAFDPFTPLDTDIKREMTEQHVTPLEEIVHEAISKFAGAVFSPPQVESKVRSSHLTLPEKWDTRAIGSVISGKYTRIRGGDKRIESNGVKITVFAKTPSAAAAWKTKPNAAILLEMGKNNIVQLPGVSPTASPIT